MALAKIRFPCGQRWRISEFQVSDLGQYGCSAKENPHANYELRFDCLIGYLVGVGRATILNH